MRYVASPRGVLSIHISAWALTGASLEMEFRECAASFWRKGGIPGTEGNAALVRFRDQLGGAQKALRKDMKYSVELSGDGAELTIGLRICCN